MVIIVAAVLSFAATSLKPLQDKNIEIEKKLDILKSVSKAADVADAESKNEYVEGEYTRYITESIVINPKGEVLEGVEAFDIDVKIELNKALEDRNLPIFICTFEDSTKRYIIPVRGKGLWGPIWGYVALYDDYNTIFGSVFAHKGETPGLGAEIDQPFFQEQFVGKKIMEGDKFVSIEVVKGGAKPGDDHGVDAISGGTITSKALEAMLLDCLASYETYFVMKKDDYSSYRDNEGSSENNSKQKRDNINY